jgi:hypothetical protein
MRKKDNMKKKLVVLQFWAISEEKNKIVFKFSMAIKKLFFFLFIELSIALETFAVCRNRKRFTLAEIREQDTARIAIRIITNDSHPIRSYFMNNKVYYDEYATKPRTIKPIFIRAIEY